VNTNSTIMVHYFTLKSLLCWQLCLTHSVVTIGRCAVNRRQK
jgi:hypothetical protein